ncbi:MAG: 3-isopropylmalate dehydratase small subunit, partial [Acidimicrobiales bacterium]
ITPWHSGIRLKRATLVPVKVEPDVGRAVMEAVVVDPAVEVTVDVDRRLVSVAAAGIEAPFELDDFTRERLLAGLDDIDVTLGHAGQITSYEGSRPAWMPTVSTQA